MIPRKPGPPPARQYGVAAPQDTGQACTTNHIVALQTSPSTPGHRPSTYTTGQAHAQQTPSLHDRPALLLTPPASLGRQLCHRHPSANSGNKPHSHCNVNTDGNVSSSSNQVHKSRYTSGNLHFSQGKLRRQTSRKQCMLTVHSLPPAPSHNPHMYTCHPQSLELTAPKFHPQWHLQVWINYNL